jgi:dipeptide/tripeptide permease
MSITVTIFAEILKKIGSSKILLLDSNKTQPVKTFKLLFSTFCLILIEAFTAFAFFHFIFMGDTVKKEKNPKKFNFLSVYMIYLYCLGFVIPSIIILSVDNMRKYVHKSITNFWTNIKLFDQRFLKRQRRKVEPNVQIILE